MPWLLSSSLTLSSHVWRHAATERPRTSRHPHPPPTPHSLVWQLRCYWIAKPRWNSPLRKWSTSNTIGWACKCMWTRFTTPDLTAWMSRLTVSSRSVGVWGWKGQQRLIEEANESSGFSADLMSLAGVSWGRWVSRGRWGSMGLPWG